MTNNKIKLQSKKNIKGILVSMACAIIGIGVGISVGFAIWNNENKTSNNSDLSKWITFTDFMKLKLDLVDLPKDERDYSEKLGNDSEVTKEVMTLFNDTSLYNALLDQGRKYMLVEIGNIAYENSNLKIDWMFDHSYFKLDDFSFEEAHTKIQSQYEFKMDYDFVWQHQNYFHPIITRSTRDINGKYAPVELESIYNRYNDGEITEVEMLTGHNSIWTSIQNNGQPLQEISKDDDFFVENAFLLLPNVKFPNYYLCNNTIAYQSPSINDPDYTVLHSTIKVNSSMIMPEGDPLSYWHNNQDDWEITNILYCSPFDDSVLPIYYDLDEYTATFSFHEPDLNIPSDLAYMDVTITAKLGITFVNGYSYWLTFSNGEQIFNVGY